MRPRLIDNNVIIVYLVEGTIDVRLLVSQTVKLFFKTRH